MSVFLQILAMSLVEFIGDSSFKIYTRGGALFYLIIGWLSYISIAFFLIHILKYSNVAYMNLQWDGLSILLETLLAFILLKETLSNRIQYTGMTLMIVGIFLLNYGKVPV